MKTLRLLLALFSLGLSSLALADGSTGVGPLKPTSNGTTGG